MQCFTATCAKKLLKKNLPVHAKRETSNKNSSGRGSAPRNTKMKEDSFLSQTSYVNM